MNLENSLTIIANAIATIDKNAFINVSIRTLEDKHSGMTIDERIHQIVESVIIELPDVEDIIYNFIDYIVYPTTIGLMPVCAFDKLPPNRISGDKIFILSPVINITQNNNSYNNCNINKEPPPKPKFEFRKYAPPIIRWLLSKLGISI